jgi:hypothetical protein
MHTRVKSSHDIFRLGVSSSISGRRLIFNVRAHDSLRLVAVDREEFARLVGNVALLHFALCVIVLFGKQLAVDQIKGWDAEHSVEEG